MRVPRVDRYFILILFFSLFALAPLSAPGYFSGAHDARHSVYFLQMFDQSMRDGAWFPRWAADMVFGYGYPLWLILAPLPFFLGEAFHFVGLDFVSAVKLVDGVAIFFSALAMFGFAARVFTPNKNAALVAAIAYVYIPYHLVDLYVRAAQAELLSFVFPPLILWALHLLAEKQSARHVAYVGFAYAGLLLSHISMAMLFTPLIATYALFLLLSNFISDQNRTAENVATRFRISRRTINAFRFAMYGFLSALLAFGIAAIFLLPVLTEQRYLTSEPLIGGFFSYRKHFLNASQLVSPLWGYGYAGENGADQFSLQLGLLPLFLAFIAIGRARALTLQLKRHIFFFVAILAFTIFAMLPISANLWDSFAGVIAFAQFPWRGLILAAVALAFLAGAAIATFAESARGNARGILVCLLIVTANFSYTLPQHSEAVFNYAAQMEFEVKDRELLGDTIWTQTRPPDSPLVAQYLAGAPLQKAIAPDDGAMVETTRHAGQSDELRVIANQPARIIVLTRYFPGWTATLDGAPLLIEPYGEQGLIFFRVSAGAHRVHLRFDDTPPRQLGVLISLASILLALGLIAKNSAR